MIPFWQEPVYIQMIREECSLASDQCESGAYHAYLFDQSSRSVRSRAFILLIQEGKKKVQGNSK